MFNREGQLTVEEFASMSTRDILMAFTSKDGIQQATDLIYKQECSIYRAGAGVTPEGKIIFCIGDGETNDLRNCQNFDGTSVRTKPASFAKAPEVFEVIAEISAFLEDKPGATTEKLYSEIADIFYNLFHLIQTDSDFATPYSKWIEALADVLGLTVVQVGHFVLAKYRLRMYDNLGKNSFEAENDEIRVVLNEIGAASKDQISNFYSALNTLWNQCLSLRLEQLGGEYLRDNGLIANGLIHLGKE